MLHFWETHWGQLVSALIYSLIGIDPHKTYQTPSGLRVPLVTGGTPIKAIVG